MEVDGEDPSLDSSYLSSYSTTEESVETTTLQSERAPLKRKSDEDLGSDQKRRLVEETESSDKAIWMQNDEMKNTESHGENGSEGKEICEPSEPERRVIISTLSLYSLSS